jgi:hypothetical protein
MWGPRRYPLRIPPWCESLPGRRRTAPLCPRISRKQRQRSGNRSAHAGQEKAVAPGLVSAHPPRWPAPYPLPGRFHSPLRSEQRKPQQPQRLPRAPRLSTSFAAAWRKPPAFVRRDMIPRSCLRGRARRMGARVRIQSALATRPLDYEAHAWHAEIDGVSRDGAQPSRSAPSEYGCHIVQSD